MGNSILGHLKDRYNFLLSHMQKIRQELSIWKWLFDWLLILCLQMYDELGDINELQDIEDYETWSLMI